MKFSFKNVGPMLQGALFLGTTSDCNPAERKLQTK